MKYQSHIIALVATLALVGCSRVYHCNIEAVVDLDSAEPRNLPPVTVFTFEPETDTGTMLGGEARGLLEKGPRSTEGGYLSPYVAMVKMDGSFRAMTLSDEGTGKQVHASGHCKEM